MPSIGVNQQTPHARAMQPETHIIMDSESELLGVPYPIQPSRRATYALPFFLSFFFFSPLPPDGSPPPPPISPDRSGIPGI